ncbi:hypothetical protein [Caldithrix abyssi]
MLEIKNSLNFAFPPLFHSLRIKIWGEGENLYFGNFSPMVFNICAFINFYSTIQLINYSTNTAAQKFSNPARADRIFQGKYPKILCAEVNAPAGLLIGRERQGF